MHGIKRIDHLYQPPPARHPRLVLHYGDLIDSSNLFRIIPQVLPDEIHDPGAQSIDAGLNDCLYMGNHHSLRDWGHAKLGWSPTATLEQLVAEMVVHDKQEVPKKRSCASRAWAWWSRHKQARAWRYQSRWQGKACMAGSKLTRMSPFSSAWAARRRSKGSRCGIR